MFQGAASFDQAPPPPFPLPHLWPLMDQLQAKHLDNFWLLPASHIYKHGPNGGEVVQEATLAMEEEADGKEEDALVVNDEWLESISNTMKKIEQRSRHRKRGLENQSKSQRRKVK